MRKYGYSISTGMYVYLVHQMILNGSLFAFVVEQGVIRMVYTSFNVLWSCCNGGLSRACNQGVKWRRIRCCSHREAQLLCCERFKAWTSTSRHTWLSHNIDIFILQLFWLDFLKKDYIQYFLKKRKLVIVSHNIE